MHDVDAAALRLKTTLVDVKNVPDVAQAAFDRALVAEEVGDLKAAAKEWDAFAVTYANPTVSTTNPPNICFVALTYEKTGQSAKADVALNAVGKLTYVDCYRFRGDLLEVRGDWAGAQAWYVKAVKLGPSIPSGYYSWGVGLARHGDVAGAEAKLKDANLRGPHWADPLKAWGADRDYLCTYAASLLWVRTASSSVNGPSCARDSRMSRSNLSAGKGWLK
jgi:tetratricopeptide (TPR) repeat protein